MSWPLVALGACSVGVALVAASAGPSPRLVAPTSARVRHTHSPPVNSRAVRLLQPVEWLGRHLRSAVGREPDAASDHRLFLHLILAIIVGLISVELAAATLAVLGLARIMRRRRHARAKMMQVTMSLAELIDLFAVALHSGHNVATATRHVSEWATGEVAAALRSCCEQADHGHQLADALERLPLTIGAPVRPLVSALVAHDRYGAPIGQALVQLAADARVDRRRQAETAARRLPVGLLFPLVLCVLPAFVLLTVVPVMADALASLRGL